MKKKSFVLMMAAILTFSMTACGGRVGKEMVNTQETSAETEESKSVWAAGESMAAAGKESASEEEEQLLYNDYIEINNFMLGRVYDSLDRYFSYVEFQEEFVLTDPDYWCYSMISGDMEYLEEAYELASAKSDKSTLDEAFLAMYPSLKQLMVILDDVYDYTDMKSYLDDDYAKGKEYHAALWNAMAEYEVTGETFMDELDIVADQRNAESLKMLKNEGYETLYAINMVLTCAGEIQDALYEQGVTDENILDMDMEVIQPIYDEFVANIEVIMANSENEEQLRYEGIPVNSAYWHTFLSSMKDTKVSLTEVLQHVKDGEPLDEFDTLISEIAGNCSLASFDTGVSEMIDDYNRMVSY